MVTRCCVCSKKHVTGINVSFHCFPQDPELRKKWLRLTRKTVFKGSVDNLRICSDHFKSRDFVLSGCGLRRLKKTAQPRNLPWSTPEPEENDTSQMLCEDIIEEQKSEIVNISNSIKTEDNSEFTDILNTVEAENKNLKKYVDEIYQSPGKDDSTLLPVQEIVYIHEDVMVQGQGAMAAAKEDPLEMLDANLVRQQMNSLKKDLLIQRGINERLNTELLEYKLRENSSPEAFLNREDLLKSINGGKLQCQINELQKELQRQKNINDTLNKELISYKLKGYDTEDCETEATTLLKKQIQLQKRLNETLNNELVDFKLREKKMIQDMKAEIEKKEEEICRLKEFLHKNNLSLDEN